MRQVQWKLIGCWLACSLLARPGETKPPSCHGAAEDCSESYELPIISHPPTVFCDEPHPCVVLINRSPDVQLYAFGIQTGDEKGKPLWLNLFQGEFELYPFKATKWYKSDELPCKLTFRLLLRYKGKKIEPFIQEIDMCRQDEKGRYLSNFLCLHYPPIDTKDIPEGYNTCTWPLNQHQEKKGRVNVTADASP